MELTDNQFLSLLSNMNKMDYRSEEWTLQVVSVLQERQLVLDISNIEYVLNMMLLHDTSSPELLSSLADQVHSKMHLIPL